MVSTEEFFPLQFTPRSIDDFNLRVNILERFYNLTSTAAAHFLCRAYGYPSVSVLHEAINAALLETKPLLNSGPSLSGKFDIFFHNRNKQNGHIFLKSILVDENGKPLRKTGFYGVTNFDFFDYDWAVEVGINNIENEDFCYTKIFVEQSNLSFALKLKILAALELIQSDGGESAPIAQCLEDLIHSEYWDLARVINGYLLRHKSPAVRAIACAHLRVLPPVDERPEIRFTPRMINDIRKIFQIKVEQDNLKCRYEINKKNIISVRDLIQMLYESQYDPLNKTSLKPKDFVFNQLKSKRITDLWDREILANGLPTGQNLKTSLFNLLVIPAIQGIVTELFLVSGGTGHSEAQMTLMAEAQMQFHEFIHWIEQPEQIQYLAEEIGSYLFEFIQDRTLLSFYIAENFLQESPEKLDDSLLLGEPLESVDHSASEIPTESGTVRVVLKKRCADEDEIVWGRLWMAALFDFNKKLIALVDGCLYKGRGTVADRDAIDANDMMIAADVIGEDEVLSMDALLDFEEDLPELLRDRDMVTLHRWQRMKDAPKGSGAECLLIALREIKRRHRTVKHLAIHIMPGQLKEWTYPHEHPEFAREKIRAVEAIQCYLNYLHPEKILGKMATRSDVTPKIDTMLAYKFGGDDALSGILGKYISEK